MLTFRTVNIIALFILVLLGLTGASWEWFILLLVLHGVISYWGTTQISSQFHMSTLCNIPNHPKKEIAITFDDGILSPTQTNYVLDLFKKYQVPATFFCIGKNITTAAQQATLLRLHQEGHLVGNHSYSHANAFDFYGVDRIIAELEQTNQIIFQTIGKTPTLFRPPYGITTPNIAKAVQKTDFHTIGWSVRSLDTVIKDQQKLLKRVCSKVKNGDIVLFHDHLPHLPEVLTAFLEYVLKEGYTIKRVDELLQLKPYKEN